MVVMPEKGREPAVMWFGRDNRVRYAARSGQAAIEAIEVTVRYDFFVHSIAGVSRA